jgi:hypothetical protein
MEDDDLRVITREGNAMEIMGQVYERQASWYLNGYISEGNRQVLVDDGGKMFPVCRIKSIDVKYEPLIVKVTYRTFR